MILIHRFMLIDGNNLILNEKIGERLRSRSGSLSINTVFQTLLNAYVREDIGHEWV